MFRTSFSQPDINSWFILTTDASKVAAVAILSQTQDGGESPIAFASRNNEQRAKLLCLSSRYVGSNMGYQIISLLFFGNRLTVRTEHSALTYLHTFAGNNSRLMRWSLRLAEFDFFIEHRPRTLIKHVHALSRHEQTLTANQTLSKELIKAE
jgi:hypothetical protein